KAGGAQVGFELRHAGVKRRLAAIDLAKPLTKGAGKLCHLQLQLLTPKLEILARHRGDHLRRRLFHLEHWLAGVRRDKRVNNFRTQWLLGGSLSVRCWAVLCGRMRWINPRASRRDKPRRLIRSPCFDVSYSHASPCRPCAANLGKLDLIGKLSHVL